VTSRDRADRDARIVASRLRGRTWASIAREFNLTARQAQRIFAAWRTCQPGLGARDSILELEELLAVQTQAIADLAELSERESVQDSVRVAAITRRVEIAERRLVFQRSFGTLRAEAIARDLLDRFLAVVNRHDDLPADFIQDLSAIVDEHEPGAPER
jgi:hypothetical protein